MGRFKISKEGSKRIAVGAMLVSYALNLVGCSEIKMGQKEEVPTQQPSLSDSNATDSVIFIRSEIIKKFPNLSKDTAQNFSLILLLDSLAKKDENGKISSDIIRNYKTSIDANNMMSDFYAVLDNLEFIMIENNAVIPVSGLLPKGYEKESLILQAVESITSNIMNLVNNASSKEEINAEFTKIYKLFVLEEEIEENKIIFSIRDLSYSMRALASAYARTAAYYAREYITEEEKTTIDARTNEQNSKPYIKTILEILDNDMPEKSETDVTELFNEKYDEFTKILNGKINLSDGTIIDLTNYANLEYLNSEKVSYKDKNTVLGTHEDKDVSDTILAIEAISTYNLKNDQNLIRVSDLLVENYKITEQGKIDTIALDFVQFNSIMLLKTIGEEKNAFNNPYFNNLYKYLTKQNFSHTYGNETQVDVNWQGISDGANFINFAIIRYTLGKIDVKNIEDYNRISNENLNQAIQFIQNSIIGECEKTDIAEFVLRNMGNSFNI